MVLCLRFRAQNLKGNEFQKPENHARCTGAPESDDGRQISLSISWIRVQSNRPVRCGLSWTDGRDFHRARFANYVLYGELPRRRYDDVKNWQFWHSTFGPEIRRILIICGKSH